MAYKRQETTDGITVMNKALYDNLQDGIDLLSLSSKFTKFIVGKNVFNPDTVTEYAYINDSTGKITSNTFGTFVSEEIPTNGAKKAIISYIRNDGTQVLQTLKIYQYKVSGEFISVSSDSVVALNDDCDYIRVYASDNFTRVRSRIMVELADSSATTFTKFNNFQMTFPPKLVGATVPISSIMSRVILSPKPVKIKLIGDSITQGLGSSDYDASGEVILSDNPTAWSRNVGSKAWASMFKSRIESGYNASVTNNGVRGCSTHQILYYWNQLIDGDEDIVIVMLGTNNRTTADVIQQNYEFHYTKQSFYDELKEIKSRLDHDGTNVVFMSAPPASLSNESQTGIHFHMNDVDDVIAKFASDNNIEYLSLYKKTLDYMEKTGATLDDLLDDGLHPNDTLHTLMYYWIIEGLWLNSNANNNHNTMTSHVPNLINTVQDISNLNPKVGQVYQTNGFYSVGDGGSTKFIITSSAPDVPLYYAVNGVYVGIEKKATYDARELGFSANSDIDNTEIFNSLHPCKCEIKFPAGNFAFSELLINQSNHIFTLSGYDAKTQKTDSAFYTGTQTYFIPYESNQKYILKIGGFANCDEVINSDNNNPYQGLYFSGFTIRDIAFSDNGKPVTEYMVMIEACALISGNLDFRNSTSKCLSFKNTWEHYWDFIIMRGVAIEPMTYDVHEDDNEHPSANWKINALWDILPADMANNGNCSAIVVSLLDVEGVISTVLCARPGSNMDSCTIDKVQIEGSIPSGLTKSVFSSSSSDLTTGTNKYTNTNTKKLPLFAFNDSKGIIINSISLQKVGYQYFEYIHQISESETQTCTYVHILLYGYGSVYIGSIMQSTTFHLFTLSASKTASPTGKQFTIGSYVCDKTSLIPAVTSGVDYIYRVYTSSGTNVLYSTVQIYKNGVGLPTPKTLAFIQSSSGSDTYFPATPTNARRYPCVRFHGNGYRKVVPNQMGCCDTLKIVAQISNASLTVNRYKAGTQVTENENAIKIAPASDETASMKRWELIMPTGVDYDSYEIVYRGTASDSYIELCSIAVE